MILIERATLQHVEGISDVCSRGYRATYGESHPESYIERIIEEFIIPTGSAVKSPMEVTAGMGGMWPSRMAPSSAQSAAA